MSVNVTSNLPAFAKAIDAFGKNQMPFAMSQALNDAAFETRRNTIERVWPSDVDAKNRSFMKAAMMPIRGDNRATKEETACDSAEPSDRPNAQKTTCNVWPLVA